MKPFKSLILVLDAYLFIAAVLTAQVHAQAQTQLEEDPQAAAHFDAGVAAYQANDLPLAYEEFLAAAREGHADSQFNVALMYEQGLGVGKDEQEAVVWYGKSAAQGNSSAQYNMGVLYENGRGTRIWFERANSAATLSRLSARRFARHA